MGPPGRDSLAPVAAAVGLAFVLWAVIFVLRPGNFFLLMAGGTSLLAALAWFLQGGVPKRADLTPRHVLLGLGAALLLYVLFVAGNAGLKLMHAWWGLFPDRLRHLDAVYANRGSLPPALVGLLLVFPIGFGEELFWRGFVQARLAQRLGRWPGCGLATALYVAAHLCTGNPVLLLAALVGGLFWGGLYAQTGSLTLVLAAHMAWDPLIFVLLQVR